MGLKFNCPNASCRQRIEVEDALAGQEVFCPKCSSKVFVPGSHDIRFTCHTLGCDQHLVVEVSEAGRFVRCPTCGKPQRIPGNPPKSSMPGAGGLLADKQNSIAERLKSEFPQLSRPFRYEDQAAQVYFSAVLIGLLLLGLAKIASFGFKSWYPDGQDAVLNLPMNRVMVGLGFVECSVAVVCAWVSKIRLAGLILLWFACNWWIWRAGKWILNQMEPFPALGIWADSIGISESFADQLMMIFTLGMSLGSGLFLWRQYRVSRAV